MTAVSDSSPNAQPAAARRAAGAGRYWRRAAAALGILLSLPAAATDTITLCYERQDVLPWRKTDGTGLNFELLNQVAARLDLRFDYRSMPWKRCLEQLKADEVGGAFAVSFNAERMLVGEFPGGSHADASKRMHVDRYVLLRRKGSTVDWDGKSFHNLDGAIGFQLGYSVGDFLRAQRVQVDEGSQRASELAQKLVAGHLAAAAFGGSDAVLLMHGPLAAELEMLPTPLIEKPYFLVLSHALAGANPQLAKRIWATIEEVRESPAYRKATHDGLLGAGR